MVKNANDPVAMAVAALTVSVEQAAKSETSFGAFVYHLYHVISDVERMGDAFQIGPDWMNIEAVKGRDAVVTRAMQLLYPVPETLQETKNKTAKAVFGKAQQDRRKLVKEGVEMLAGMCRMGDMFGEDGAQWEGNAWRVPAQWFVKDGEINAIFLSGQGTKLFKGTHVPLLSKNAAHSIRATFMGKDGEEVERIAVIRPNRSSIAALGMPKQERVQSQQESEGTPVMQAGNLLSKLLDQAEEMKQPAITGDAADAFADVIQRIVRNPHLWQLVQTEREAFLKEQNASKAAA
jgi:hypothetical protein